MSIQPTKKLLLVVYPIKLPFHPNEMVGIINPTKNHQTKPLTIICQNYPNLCWTEPFFSFIPTNNVNKMAVIINQNHASVVSRVHYWSIRFQSQVLPLSSHLDSGTSPKRQVFALNPPITRQYPAITHRIPHCI